ncbi:hypothetical protein G7017_06750 [Pseudomonas fulva]|uniref:hypothetical protein n=1 Tax=Pseudomonas fulva TaxID=47880 RepID=UPI0015E4686F|nr:hypothetical protein [Pseudomonas fulva]MBA1220599.1 hypothetical protein [Pseudomonas fulva]MBN4168059.1 hypothetical protein [Pseudomonas fulva]
MKAVQWTVFIDMLGFSELNSKVVSDSQASELIEFMNSNLSFMGRYEGEVRAAYEGGRGFNLYEWYDVKTTFISDSLVLTFKPREVERKEPADKVLMHSANALMLIGWRLMELMQKCLAEQRIIFRGGVSTEYCDIEGNFAVGKGLSLAHHAESKKAIFPRLVLADDVLRNQPLIDKIKWLYRKMYGRNNFIQRDGGVWAVNILQLMLASADPSSPSVKWQMKDFSVREKIIKSRVKVEEMLSRQKELIRSSISVNYASYRAGYADVNKRELHRKILKKYFWLRRSHNNEISKFNYDQFKV